MPVERGRPSIAQGLRWRANGFRRDARVMWAAFARRGPRLGFALSHLGRRPSVNKPAFLKEFCRPLLADWQACADGVGLRWHLAFGTLLGLVRDGGPIEHDHDVDVAVVGDDWASVNRATEAMQVLGYDVKLFGDYEVRFMSPRTGLVNLDVFRFKPSDDGYESRALSSRGLHRYWFPADLVEGTELIQWQGLDLPAPAGPERILAHHYGGGWNVPAPAWDYRTDAASAVRVGSTDARDQE